MRIVKTFAIIVGLLSGSLTAFSQALDNQCIVRLADGIDIHRLENLPGHIAIEKISHNLNVYLVECESEVQDRKMRSYLRQSKYVLAVQDNRAVYLRDTSPNDPQFPQQYNLLNTGQSGGVLDADVDATQMWDSTLNGVSAYGDTIVVAIVDGRFDLFHEDLDYFKNYNEVPFNGIDDDNNGYIDDYQGWNAYDDTGWVHTNFTFVDHATHVAGIAGAKGNNNIGISGVNWNVKILPVAGSSSNEATVIKAYDYILEMKQLYLQSFGTQGAFVVAANSSFGVDDGDPADYPIWCAFYDSLGAYGVISTAATANDDVDVDIDGDMPTTCSSNFLISVTNTTRNDELNGGAGFGSVSIDLGAPGTGVLSTEPGDNYDTQSGTSMAAPHVAGVVSVMFDYACPQLIQDYLAFPDSIAQWVIDNVLAGVDPNPDLAGITTTGGRLNGYTSMLYMDHYNCNQCDFTINEWLQHESCDAANSGVAAVIANADPSILSYSWSTGSTDSIIDQLAPGIYQCVITDTAGCSQKRNFIIRSASPITVTQINITQPINAGQTGTIDLQGHSSNGTSLWYAIDNQPAQNSGTFSGLPVGVYTFTITDSMGCTVDTTLTLSPVGIETPSEFSFQLYPNPAEDVIRLSVQGIGEHMTMFTLVDELGREALTRSFSSTESIEVSVKNIPSGVYIATIRYNGFSAHRKLILR